MRPLASVEADARLLPERNVQGTRGFGVRRARLGLEAGLGAGRLVVQAELAGASAGLLDAFGAWQLAPGVEVVAGYQRHPAFVSGPDLLAPALPLMERSLTVQALWPGRDAGVEVRLTPPGWPLEARLRASNGANSPLANSDAHLALAARVDGVWRGDGWGLRLGATGAREEVDDQAGIAGRMPLGYTFYRPAAISGQRLLLAGHLHAYAGPLALLVEGGVAEEGRAQDTDGDPATPREARASLRSGAVSGEVLWTPLGPPRGERLGPPAGRALEVALRAERLWLGRGAPAEVAPGGAWGGAAALRGWLDPARGLGLSAHLYRLDAPPLDDPGAAWAWVVIARATWLLGAPGGPPQIPSTSSGSASTSTASGAQ